MVTTKSFASAVLKTSTALSALMLAEAAVLTSPAYAQDQGTTAQSSDPSEQDQSTGGAPQAGTDAPAVPVQNVNAGAAPENEEIVVTGTIFRRTNTETASPVTVLSSESLSRRGITNVADAVRSISADNAGSVPSAFSNGFGGGGAAPALRGLTVNSTITLMDGQRVTIYPLADDGQRSFVDLNTLPRVALERVEVLKDGASSTYGADAIGGVVNLITRKAFNGVDANLEYGITERGDGDHYRGSFLAGMGDYDARGFNMYIGGEYESNGPIFTADRGFPYNTADLTRLPGGLDLTWASFQNGNGANGPVLVTRPAIFAVPGILTSAAAVPGSESLLVNPSQCAAFGGTVIDADIGGTTCKINQYEIKPGLTIQPKSIRWGAVARTSVRLSDTAEAYLMGSFYESKQRVYPLGSQTRSTNPINTTGLALPAYLSNGQVNPNNPYASAGCDPVNTAATNFCPGALLRFRFPNIDRTFTGTSKLWRIAAGVNGTLGDAWNYQIDATASASDLRRVTTGNILFQGLINAINTGSYNFRDPLSNSQEVVDSILQTVDTTSQSHLYAIQAIVGRKLVELAGGPLQIGVGGQIRHEELDNPNQNPGNQLIGVNQVFARGQRTVKAAFFEISAPVIKQLEINVSGRYDDYSTGFSNFSPKAGIKFTPIPQLALRGTYAKGFRAPSFAESGESGVIGFTGPRPPCVVRIQHGATGTAASCTGGNSYVLPQALGYNSAGNFNLKPEKSRSLTLGLIAQPIPALSFTVDYYNINKKDVITAGPLANQAISNFYNGVPLPAGYSVQLYPSDPEFPNGIRVVSIVNSPYENAASIKTTGIDFSVLFQKRFSPGVKLSSQLEATKILKFNFKPCQDSANPACDVQKYAGTMGPYQLSAGGGTPDWRGNWSTSLEFGRATLTGTANYVGSYYDTATDTSPPFVDGVSTYKNCDFAGDLYANEFCKTKRFIWVDLVGSYKFTDWVTGYFNVLNLFDAKAPIEPANYAGPAANYNPQWHQSGAVGRSFRIGANFSFRPKAHEEVYVAPPAPPPPPPPATITCPDGLVIMAGQQCPAPPPPPPPPPPAPERGN